MHSHLKVVGPIYGSHFGGKINWFQPQKKEKLKRKAHDLKNQDASWGPRQGQTQTFNLVQMSPNWSLRIWNLDTHLKWAASSLHG